MTNKLEIEKSRLDNKFISLLFEKEKEGDTAENIKLIIVKYNRCGESLSEKKKFLESYGKTNL